MKNQTNLLFVEDSGIILLEYKKIFVLNKNITTYVANTLGRAMAIVQEKKIDIVTLDISLPDGNGIDFLKWIKKEFCNVYVIMMSCYNDEMFERVTKNYGASYFLDKSDCEKLPKIVYEFIEKKLGGGGGVKEIFFEMIRPMRSYCVCEDFNLGLQ